MYYGFPNDYGLEVDVSNPSYSDRTTGFFAFRGMTVIYIISRGVMALQYCLLFFYAIHKQYPASKQFLIQVGALLVSAGLWIGSFFMEAEDASDAMKIAKYGLWYGGILIELLASIIAWLSCRVTGFRRTHLTERFATLTLLILGEGVIGYAIALQSSILPLLVLAKSSVVGGVGFGAPSALAIVMVVLIIYLLWVYYFSTFLENASYNVIHAYGWAYSHFPFHVSLILILQACNSLMLYANVWNAVEAFGSGDPHVIGDLFQTFYPYPPNATVGNFTVGNTTVTWNPQQVYNDTFLDSLSPIQGAVLFFEFFSKIFESYSIHLPETFEELFDELAHGQIPISQDIYEQLVGLLILRFLVSAVYYLVACGALLLFSAIILLIQRWPSDWFSWVGIYARILFGCGFVALIAIWDDDSEPGGDYLNSGTMLPTFVLVLLAICMVSMEGAF